MFVFSVQQFSALIDFEINFGGNKLNNLLDLGAGNFIVKFGFSFKNFVIIIFKNHSGDGAVTAKMVTFQFNQWNKNFN